MTLPNFLVIGAMKAGTTSLWAYLRAHPDVFMPEEKEPDFFVAEKAWVRGTGWYTTLFDGADAFPARGEASTNYSKHPLFSGVPGRVAAVVPDVRLVYLVRHPLERIRSHYLHAVRAGWERRPLPRAAVADRQYLDISLYAMQLDRWLEHFEPAQILVVTAESLRDERAQTVAHVLRFVGARQDVTLGLDRELHGRAEDDRPPRWPGALTHVPGRAAAARLTPPALRRAISRRVALDSPARLRLPSSVEERLLAELRPDVARLRRFLGDDFDGWGLA